MNNDRDREARMELVSLFEKWANEDDKTPADELTDEIFRVVLKNH